METNLIALFHRLRLGNFEKNRNQKYRVYARSDDFFNKIGNKSDEMMRVALFLTKFLISTPPKLKGIPQPEGPDEDLLEYDDQKNSNDQSKAWEHHALNYTLYDMEDLPILLEAEFDANLMMFHAFLSFIKPTNYFIAKFEMYRSQTKETKKQNVTRVLMNLSQLLLFGRSIRGAENLRDIFTVAYCLFYKFDGYFSIQQAKDESLAHANVFEMFPTEAAYLLVFLLAYDNYKNTSIEQFKEEYPKIINPIIFNTTSERFQNALESHMPTLNVIMNDSKTMEEIVSRLQNTVEISFLWDRVLQIAKVMTTKVLLAINDISDWDAQPGYMELNYEGTFNQQKENHERTVCELRLNLEKEFDEKEKRSREELNRKYQRSMREKTRLTEEKAVQAQELLIIRNENARLRKELESKPHEETPLTFQDIERKYPKLLKDIRNTTYRLSIKKAHIRITDLEEELTKLRQTMAATNPITDEQSLAIRGPDLVEEHVDFYDDSRGEYYGYGRG